MELAQILQNDIGGFLHHNAQRSILYIAGGKTLVDILGIITDILCHIGKECDDIMVRYLFNFMNPCQIKLCLCTDIFCSLDRNFSQLRHCLTGTKLNLKNFLELVLKCPNVSHFRIGIPLNHLVDLLVLYSACLANSYTINNRHAKITGRDISSLAYHTFIRLNCQ